jgi:hypothetical protein
VFFSLLLFILYIYALHMFSQSCISVMKPTWLWFMIFLMCNCWMWFENILRIFPTISIKEILI